MVKKPRHRSPLCSVDELKTLIEQQSVNILDGSWYLPSQNIDCRRAFEQAHIPGAQFFDIDLISDHQSELPHMLPSAEQFAEQVSELGVSNNSEIVIYDTSGLFSAARVWWMFKVFGHDNVRVLNGGLPSWREQGGKVQTGNNKPLRSSYTAELKAELVADKARLIENMASNEYIVLDARPKERFLGVAPEPRPGLPSGHMPESISFSAANLINDGHLVELDVLKNMFGRHNINASTPVITSCGSGVTAAIITLALAEAGFGLHKLYDGSWAEWACADDTQIINESRQT